MRSSLFTVLLAILLLVPIRTCAQVAITEVLWAGSDLSTADEWFELQNFSSLDSDLSNWTVTYLTSKGDEGLIARFATGTILSAGELMVVARNHADASRLLLEPHVVVSTMSLLNTKLLLKLKDAQGAIVDTVDDGVGSPFAGANPSGGTKASMERLDPMLPGTDPLNWVTASTAQGLDPEAVLFATPGYPREQHDPPGCIDPLAVQIFVQDGELSGVGHTTVNFQAIATAGSIETATCRWIFSDGYVSSSCNPPPHAFEQVGVTSVRLEATNKCGNTLIQETSVTVLANAGTTPGTPTSPPYDGSRIFLSAALPNPAGADTGREWVELRSPVDRPLSLEGWKLVVGTKSLRPYSLKGSIGPHEKLRIYDGDIDISLPNTESKIVLQNPTRQDVSTILWPKAEEDRIYYPDDIRDVSVDGTVEKVIDGDTFVLALQGEAQHIVGADRVHVRLLGIDAPELLQSTTGSAVSLTSLEFLRALIENKKVDLEFDTELWDAYGRLLAYVYDDRGILTNSQLLSMGYARAIHHFDYFRKEEFLSLQEKAQSLSIGIWNDPHTLRFVDPGKSSENAVHSSVPNLEVDVLCGPNDLVVSEVYSNPYQDLEEAKKSGCSGSSCTLLTLEWVELHRSTQCSLSGWSLKLDTKKKLLDLSAMTGSGEYVIFTDSMEPFSLRNNGGIVQIISPNGETVEALTYPKLGKGHSFSLGSPSSFCTSAVPTPKEQNNCTSNAAKNRAKTIGKSANQASRTIAARYAPIFSDEFVESELELSPQSAPGMDPNHLSWSVVLLSVFGGFLSQGVFAACSRLI